MSCLFRASPSVAKKKEKREKTWGARQAGGVCELQLLVGSPVMILCLPPMLGARVHVHPLEKRERSFWAFCPSFGFNPWVEYLLR